MITTKYIYPAILVLFILGLNACSSDDKDDDTKGPIITLEKPANEDHFHIGNTIPIQFGLSDKSGIKEYKIDIHWGGGHTHSRSATQTQRADTEKPWSFQKIFTAKKGEKDVLITLETDKIPEDAKLGEYHLGILATDIHGNDSKKYIDIHIEK